jgi:hypothetical protein
MAVQGVSPRCLIHQHVTSEEKVCSEPSADVCGTLGAVIRKRKLITYHSRQIRKTGPVDQQVEEPVGARTADTYTEVQAAVGLIQVYAISTVPEVLAAVVAEVTQVAIMYHVIMLHHPRLQDFTRDLRSKKFYNR